MKTLPPNPNESKWHKLENYKFPGDFSYRYWDAETQLWWFGIGFCKSPEKSFEEEYWIWNSEATCPQKDNGKMLFNALDFYKKENGK